MVVIDDEQWMMDDGLERATNLVILNLVAPAPALALGLDPAVSPHRHARCAWHR